MRTSLNQQIQTQMRYLDVAGAKLVEAQTRAISGKRILKPSDDVAGTNRALSLRTTISNVDQFTNNIEVCRPLLAATESAVADLARATRSVRDIAVAAANPDFTGETRSAYIAQLDDILGRMVDIANSKHLDHYLFSGTATNTAPLAAQAGPNPYLYQGNSGTRRAQVLSWVSLPINIPGDKLFNFDGSAGAGTTDLFTMVAQLKEAIRKGDAAAVSAQLDNVDANLNNLLACQAQLGSWISRMDKAKETLAQKKTKLQEILSDTEDVDITKAVVELKSQENVYQAALIISSRMLDLSLATLQINR
ncbi:MAG: flagellar hook-associated protein FlgL [Armatimonadetes bacterium]|nr:flagellar hook-associated protein FlgL [Armatimonadota bacterium]